MIQIVGDGKVLGIPYLPVVDGKKREKFNSDNPNWDPGWDFRDHLTKDDREDIPFPIDEMPDFSRDEPDRRGGRRGETGGGSGSDGRPRRPNATTDPILRRGGRPDFSPTVADTVGIPDWVETVWDQFVNTPGAIGGIDKAIPFDPQGSTKQPPKPSGTRGPQHNECSRGKLPHWKHGGEHTETSKLIQFRVWLYTAYSPYRRVSGRKDDGVEHTYFKNGVPEYLLARFGAGNHVPIDVLPMDGLSDRLVITYGFKIGWPWMRGQWYSTQKTTLLWMPKRKVSLRHSDWSVYWPLSQTPREVSGQLSWYSDRSGYAATIDCIMSFGVNPQKKPNYHPPGKPYNRKDEMGCQWQKDEVDYALPELKIGDKTIGGNSIKIDDGLIPLANFVCKSMEMIHKGLGLNQLGIEVPKLVTDRGGTKIKPKTLAELTQWQFDNVSSLVGLPVETAITNLENSTKDIVFRNVQDYISYMFQQQKESDLDLMVIENYCTRIAQQLEAVTQISLRQQADIEMLVKELGFRWKWETKTRKSLYKIGMSDEDEKTGILELFKGGEVSYPVRVWDDKQDSRQIAMTTNLYSEIASKSNFHSFNTNSPIPGLDARSKMSKTNEEDWKEWVKSINTPEKGTISGVMTPYIEEYSQTSITAKKIAEPVSGLSLFMKPKKAKVTGPK